MIKIAINGFGRIGRPAFRKIVDSHPDLEVVAINDLTDTKTLAHLLKYDSVYGKYGKEVKFTGDSLIVDGRKVKVFAKTDPAQLPWKELGIDVVLECTGAFTEYEGAKKHLEAGAKKVIISAPSKSPEIATFVLGVNGEDYDSKKDNVVSMGSCTTNCLAPVVKVLNDNFKIIRGFMTTCHSYTNDQRILDLSHKDLRRARAAALNIIPTTTGAASAIGKVIKEIDGKLDGIAFRVPTPTVSILDLICEVEKKTSVEEVNKIFQKVAEKELKGILRVEETPLVSSDFIGDSYSAIVDAQLTMVHSVKSPVKSLQGKFNRGISQDAKLFNRANDSLVKVVAWYDNEWGYACRMAEFAEFIGKKL